MKESKDGASVNPEEYQPTPEDERLSGELRRALLRPLVEEPIGVEISEAEFIWAQRFELFKKNLRSLAELNIGDITSQMLERMAGQWEKLKEIGYPMNPKEAQNIKIDCGEVIGKHNSDQKVVEVFSTIALEAQAPEADLETWVLGKTRGEDASSTEE